ncbi:sodium:solute symporter family protein [Achromobacter arsenitoxydans]|uniref:Sodium:solute symporter family protein 2 n=1 Tax=Achromobacter arsenitoxydans SY8 TaxID=477184 RepID=H0F5B0_9BURK|nr:sodium:solute symporter family protein [Achromobacter arsenitoxydans]EHK66424.1 sodium:solute symporter family protein 2 [Achromobacter arsenitoxydans SY8]
MLTQSTALIWLLLFSGGFAAASVFYTRRKRSTLEDYIVARNSQGSIGTILTLMASTLGAWILFSPAQAATWGGLAAVIGYALGSMSPRLVMIPLGRRMRELIPHGHTLTEFLMARYGRPMYGLALFIMLFYLFIALSAEITAIAKLVAMLAPVPLWATAAIVMGTTLLYTTYGGLRSSIFTDQVQMMIIVPLLVVLCFVGWQATGGVLPTVEALQAKAPQLLDLTDPVGVKAGLTFFVAILLTGIFHQGNWQRIYAARDARTMRNGFLLGGALVAPFIFLMGLFGLAFVALAPGGDSSIALFGVIMPHAPAWFVIALIPLGLSLVMSTADTAISAVTSIIAVDLRRLMPDARAVTMKRLARWLVLLMAIPVMIVASQGYSVLYLFLLADLLCSAAAFPVFYGLFSRKHDGFTATAATISGLIAGLFFFPAPGDKPTYLLESFLLAAFVPVVTTVLIRCVMRGRQEFDFSTLSTAVRRLDQERV